MVSGTVVETVSLAWQGVTFCAGTLLLAGGTLHSRQAHRWHRCLVERGLARGTDAWSGVCRGRAVTVTVQRTGVALCVRTLNPIHILDELCSGVPVPRTAWLSPLTALHLSALVSAPGDRDRWRLKVHNHNVCFTCRSVCPEQFPFVLDLACDVAEDLDRFGVERRAI